MKIMRGAGRTIAGLFSLALGLLPATTVQADVGSDAAGGGVVERSPLFARMVRVNSNLRTYQSHVHLEVAMHSFPFLSPTLEGTVYYKAPDKNVIIFDEVPALASLFKKVFPRLDPPATWPILYRLSFQGDAAGRTTVRLEPKKNGTIQYLDVVVDDVSAVPVGYTYRYRNGGNIHFDQTVQSAHGVYVVKTLNGHVNLPSTAADVKSDFDQYQINVPIKDAIFNQASAP